MAQTPYLPNPHNWSASEILKTYYLRSDVSGLTQLLATPPVAFITAQSGSAVTVPSGTVQAVNLDTEIYDTFGGYNSQTHSGQNYYGMFDGWYLCQGQVAWAYSGAASKVAAGIGSSTGGGVVTQYIGGQNDSVNTHIAQTGAMAKLIQMTNVGFPGGAVNDYVQLLGVQATGSNQGWQESTSNFPWLNVRWVCASSGTQPLAAPAPAAWPQPPALVTASFANTNIENVINFLTYPPICEVYLNSAQTLSQQASYPTVGTTINLDTKVVDNYSAFNTGTHTWTAPVAGVYWVYVQGALTTVATTVSYGCGITITSNNYNGGTQFTSWTGLADAVTTGGHSTQRHRRLRLNANDTLQFAVFQHDSGAATTALQTGPTGNTCRAIIIWEPR